MKILLARHGETPWNAEGRYQGRTDIPLSDIGIAQAQALGRRLADVRIDRAVASPLARAAQTARLALGEARAAMLTFDDGFLEIGHGDWEGLLTAEIAQRDPERLNAWRQAPDTVKMPGPGGESLQDVETRAWAALTRACAGLGAEDVLLVVAHDAVNRVLLARLLGIPLVRVWDFRQAPATLNLLEGPSVDALEVVRLNDCTHHTPLFGEAKHRAL
ncbi:histidine phosphatase family protein [Thermomonas hydrothermalis]|uniref:Probable phosphoglycerate mutase n=1 Tax=Thermomonas hydrothermalis TaxID=213588 RepID=A0A1M4UXG4_9GAMM|nr:histidine phosphatase family protein [Thermomonas hydrothermalis]MCL6619698.1 histidine phosphatase family protein [Thermomonas hydrothermalis]SHE61365.1 probable phosphoglycerate mutase [Thermomonas hydrothermalis]